LYSLLEFPPLPIWREVVAAAEYVAFVKARLHEQFLMTDLGPLHYFLGIEVCSTCDSFYISHEKYIQDLLTRAALGDGRTVDTPI
jgi:hypothetical protein